MSKNQLLSFIYSRKIIFLLNKSVTAAVFVLLIAGQVSAQQIQTSAARQIKSLMDEKASRTPAQKKISSQVLYAFKMDKGQGITPEVTSLRTNVKKDAKGMVKIELDAVVTPQLLEALKALGSEVIFSSEKFGNIVANIPLDKAEQIASIDAVKHINQWISPTNNNRISALPGNNAINNDKRVIKTEFATRVENVRKQITKTFDEIEKKNKFLFAGSVTSQADVTHKVALARTTFGTTGVGVKIGVLSDGVTGFATSQASGDLPPVITILPGQAGSGSEGRAMMELIYDLAPGAQLYFASAFNGQASFAQNILDLRTAGCDIIVDDVTYYAEGVFQDDNVAQAVNTVTAGGALYFSSAGNSGNKNDGTAGVWEGDFVDGGVNALFPGGTLNEFAAGIPYDAITANTGVISLKWSDPLGLSANDYDLFVTDAAGTTILDASTNIQDGNDNPIEIFGGSFTGERLYILKKTGAAIRALHLNTNRGRLSINTPGVMYGHNAAGSAYTVAATPVGVGYGSTGPYPGVFNSTNKVETFSSDGPRRIFFNPNGTEITPGNILFGTNGGTLLQKPDITAADGASTATPGFTSFFGTSAAAPHAAAIAALIKAKFPLASPAQIRSALVNSAIDIEAAGNDRDAGAGIIMAYEAIQQFIIENNCPAITVNNPVVTTGPTNTPFSQAFTNSGGTGITFTTLSVLPAGLSLSAAGVLSGTPTQIGTFPITVIASQSDGCSGTGAVYNLVIAGAIINPSSPVVITAENATPANNAADPGETLTVNLPLINVGNISTTNLVATLLATGGVANPSAAQTYGVVINGGPAVARSYTFTALGNCGESIVLTLALQDGAINLGTVTYTMRLGASGGPGVPAAFSNTTPINIVDNSSASPYPSNITVSGIIGAISNITIKLNQFNHTFPSDVDVLLVSPSGQKMIIMSDAGNSADAVNLNIVLDDAAAAILSNTTLSTGTFRPTNYTAGDIFGSPAPPAPYLSPATAGSATFASAFAGGNPNGTWSLYAVDDAGADVGNFNGGWEIIITPELNVCSVAPPPELTINDVIQNEGNTGTSNYTFTVSLSAPAAPGGVSFDIATANNTATIANNDYVAKSLTSQTIPAGSLTYTFDVVVNGDVVVETDENFFVNVINVTGAIVSDGQGLGTISNDDFDVPTITTLASSLNPSCSGSAVTFTATVTSAGNPVTVGTVTFTEGATILASNVALNGSGQAAFIVSSLTAASHSITATYSGAPGFITSNGSITQVVNSTPYVDQPANQVVCNNALTAPVNFTGSSSSSVVKVLLVAAVPVASWATEVQSKLVATGAFNTVDVFNAATGTPTLAQLNAYNSVLVFSDASFNNATLLGNNLASYVDGGGGVVSTVFSTASIPIGGTFNTAPYQVIIPAGQIQGTTQTLGTVLLPAHPTMNGVTSFNGGTSSYRSTSTSLAPGGYRVANWNDGRFLITAKDNVGLLNAHRVDLGFYPPSADSRGDFWVTSTDGATIMKNALLYVASATGSVTFNWTNDNPSIGLAASGTGNIAGFTATNATNTPSVATITVTPSVNNDGAICTGTPVSFTITVNPKPILRQTYNGVQVTANNDGIDDVGSFSVCSSASDNVFLTEIADVLNIVPSNKIKVEQQVIKTNVNINTAADGNYLLSSIGPIPLGRTATLIDPAISGTVVIKRRAFFDDNLNNILDANECVGDWIVYTITVNPVPNVVATPSSQTICNGSAITTIVNSGNVNGTVYNWTRDNTVAVTGIAASGSGDISGSLTNTTNAPVTVTFTITPSYTNAGKTCTGTPANVTVVVNPIPNVVATPSSQIVCTGNAITTIVNSGNVAGTVYSWTRDNLAVTGIAANGTGNISGILTNSSAAPVTVTFTITPAYTNAGKTCTGTPISATVTVNPNLYFACPGNMVEIINDIICFKAVVNPNPVFCGTLTKLTWKLTGATTLNSPTSGINYVGLRNMNVGVTTVTYTATFAGGVVKTCSYTVTVKEIIAPEIRCPLDKDVTTDPGKCYKTGPVSLGTPVVSDNCGVASVTNNAPAVYQKGVNLVTWTVTDNSGNTRTCVQRVTVYDAEKPTLTCPANVVANTGSDCTATPVTLPHPVFADNCGVIVTLKWAMTGVTWGSSNGTGINYVPTMNYATGVSTVIYTAYDEAGNWQTCTFTVTVKDVTPPVLVCPPAQTFCKVANNVYTIPVMTQTDNCVIATTEFKITGVTSRVGSGTNASGSFNVGVSTIKWTVKDVNGNTSTCTTTVTILASNNPACIITAPVTSAAPEAEAKLPVKEVVLGLSVIAYPNPTENYFNLKINTSAKETVEIRMFDMAGKLVQTNRGAPGEIYLLGDNVVSGMYIIEVTQAGKTVRTKVVKQ